MYFVDKEQIRLFFIESLGIEGYCEYTDKIGIQTGNSKSEEKIMEVLGKKPHCGWR